MRRILLAILIVVVLALAVAVIQQQIVQRTDIVLTHDETAQRGDSDPVVVFDFYQRWHGARAMLFEGLNPYSKGVTERIQRGLYGRLTGPEECSQGFLYPAFVAFTIPHFLVPNYPLALSLWIVTQLVLLVVAIWLMVDGLRLTQNMALGSLMAVTLVATVYRYNLLTLAYSQFTIYVLFYLVLAWWLWRRRQDVLAGVALFQVASKPQVAFLLLPLWLFLAIAHRRWRFVGGLGGTAIVLLALPWFLAGNWLSGFIGMITGAVDTCQVSIYQQPGLGLRLIGSLVLGVGLLVAWLRPLKHQERFPLGYLLALTIVVTLLTTPFVHSYDMTLTTLPLAFGIVSLQHARGTLATILKGGYWFVLLGLPWLLWGLSPNHNPELVERWLIPLVVLVLLIVLPLVRRDMLSTEVN